MSADPYLCEPENDSPFAVLARYWRATGELREFDDSALDESASVVAAKRNTPRYASSAFLAELAAGIEAEISARVIRAETNQAPLGRR